jgi:hypothetical protein
LLGQDGGQGLAFVNKVMDVWVPFLDLLNNHQQHKKNLYCGADWLG